MIGERHGLYRAPAEIGLMRAGAPRSVRRRKYRGGATRLYIA